MSGLVVVTVAASALAAGAAAARLVPPTRRLAGRVRPYTVAARTSLGRAADPAALVRSAPTLGAGTLRRLFGPLLLAAGRRLGRVVDTGTDDRLAVRLQQARLLQDVPADHRVQEYRIRQATAALGGSAAGAAIGLLLRFGAAGALGLALAGLVAGATRWRARVDRAVEDRRRRMRIELYTVNQLVAMNIRVGGGVVQAIRRVADRGRGEVVAELRDVLRAHESGVPARAALERAADETPEPFVARTYRLLATGSELGSDLAAALLAHSDDVREARREALRRSATRRRAAMLVPIIGVLAPVMLLFIAAPLPSIVFSAP